MRILVFSFMMVGRDLFVVGKELPGPWSRAMQVRSDFSVEDACRWIEALYEFETLGVRNA